MKDEESQGKPDTENTRRVIPGHYLITETTCKRKPYSRSKTKSCKKSSFTKSRKIIFQTYDNERAHVIRICGMAGHIAANTETNGITLALPLERFPTVTLLPSPTVQCHSHTIAPHKPCVTRPLISLHLSKCTLYYSRQPSSAPLSHCRRPHADAAPYGPAWQSPAAPTVQAASLAGEWRQAALLLPASCHATHEYLLTCGLRGASAIVKTARAVRTFNAKILTPKLATTKSEVGTFHENEGV
jgi:hypothetical protein